MHVIGWKLSMEDLVLVLADKLFPGMSSVALLFWSLCSCDNHEFVCKQNLGLTASLRQGMNAHAGLCLR